MYLRNSLRFIGLLTAGCVLLTACSQNDDTKPQAASQAASKPTEVVLAKVNDAAITDLDLRIALESTFSQKQGVTLTKDQKQKLLQSLVASRAIAQICEKELSPDVLYDLEKNVQAFREQLLVKKYMARHADLQPVTRQMVQTYYKAHPEKFGAKTIRSFEMVYSPNPPARAQRDDLLKALSAGKQHKEWQRWSQQMKKQGYDVAYQKGQVDEQILAADLRNITKKMKKGQMSNVHVLNGRAYLIRIVDEIQIPPQPLNLVSAQIRQALAPIQLKSAITRIYDEVLKKVEVKYVNAIEGKNS